MGMKAPAANQNPTPNKGKGKNKGGGPQRRQLPTFREWSVQTKSDWDIKREIMLQSLAKLSLDAKEVTYEDVVWCGRLNSYNRSFDRITVKTEKQMRRFDELNFFQVTASDDPVLTDAMQEDPSVTVIATDHVLACIIAAARSVYSWDIIITKVQGNLIFDKREGAPIDFL